MVHQWLVVKQEQAMMNEASNAMINWNSRVAVVKEGSILDFEVVEALGNGMLGCHLA